MVSRRRFFKLSCLGCLGFFYTWRDIIKKRNKLISFYVAGVRFLNKVPSLEEGIPVNIKKEKFNKEICYGIYIHDGSFIGYVPRVLVPGIRFRSIDRSYLSSVKPHAFPWERFKVTVLYK